MKRTPVIDLAVFAMLLSAGVGLRLVFQTIPNFAPVAALALFAGYFFRSRLLATALPLSIMVISDATVIGGYAWYQMVAVYTMLTLPVFLGGPLRRWLRLEGVSAARAAGSLGGLLGCSLLGSVLFYLVTNAFCLGWYEPTVAGVVQCYVQALPFFKYTLAGDACFAMATFTSYAAVLQLQHAAAPSELATVR